MRLYISYCYCIDLFKTFCQASIQLWTEKQREKVWLVFGSQLLTLTSQTYFTPHHVTFYPYVGEVSNLFNTHVHCTRKMS